ncbi:alpha/beta fold hydrolase [Streptomyces sp. NPDC050704]|uniref:alpha/beta fold hydrolase n=1 Tax=Streptomyces sp. NPDC050704 TaxID=3157219 RepID=UPI0034481C1E
MHGFPDTGRVWAKQIAPLTEAGLRLIVPDQRGYGRSGKPSDIEAHKIASLAADPVAILDRLGVGPNSTPLRGRSQARTLLVSASVVR